MSYNLKEKADNYNYKNTSQKKSCSLQKKTDKYKYKNTSPANTLLTTDSKNIICRYKTYDVFYDEYIFFISALDYKRVDYRIKNAKEEKNIACSYQISGKYDFIVKSFYPQNVSPNFSHPKIIKDIQICKVIDRYAPQESNLVKMFNTNDFYNIDVKLSGFNLFADFVEIEAPSKGSLSDDLINALENLDNSGNANYLQYVYVIYKLENIQTKKQTWLICLRYKCYDYCERHFLQGGLDNFVDNIKHIKTTYISNNSNIRIKNIRGIFENLHYENVLGRVLCTRNIRDLMHKIYENLTYSQGDNKYLQELRKNKDFYNNFPNKVRDYQFYISYKQSTKSQNPDDSYQIRHALHKWFNGNKFEKVFVDSEVLDPGQKLEDYMQALGTSDLVVICLSEEYFRSINCMYELSLVIENSKNDLGKKAIFVAKRFLLGHLNEIKSFWLKDTPSPRNIHEEKRIPVIKQKINELDNISDRLHVILQDKDKEELHYERAIEAILSNIVEKILNEELKKTQHKELSSHGFAYGKNRTHSQKR